MNALVDYGVTVGYGSKIIFESYSVGQCNKAGVSRFLRLWYLARNLDNHECNYYYVWFD